MKTRISKVLTLTMGALLCGTMMASAQTVLRFSDYGPNRGTRAKAMEWFADEVKSRSNDDLEIEFFWGGSLLGGRDTLGGVASGVADMGTVVGFFTPQELQLYNIGDLPLESDPSVGLHAMFDLSHGEAISEEMDKAGVRYVTNYTTGPVQLICKEPVKSLDDLKGLRIRGSGPYGETLKRLGAEVTSMSQADVYQALDSGLLDCNQNYYYAMQAYRQFEVAQHVFGMDWGQNMSFGIVMNPASYDALSDENKKVLDEVSAEFVDHLAEAMQASDESAREAMVNGIDGKSITVTEISDEDRKRLAEASQPSIDEWVKRVSESGADGEAVLSNYRDLLDKYRSAQ